MKALVFKELRENLKLAALGLVIYVLLLVVQYRDYVVSPTNMYHPLARGDLLWNTAWFCGIFGAVLGWLQIHNERRPDLWAFLLHRPITRTQIFLGKALAGLGLYAAVVGLPLLVFILWALWPGHVAAPFEPKMLRPLASHILAGVAFYFAGMLTGLRQARWYGSRALGLGLPLIAFLVMQIRPEWWQGWLVILLGAVVLIAAAWGGFQSHGYYRGQPALGKAALIFAIMLGGLIVALTAALLVSNLFPQRDRSISWSKYVMTKDGTIFKVTRGPGETTQIVDLEGKPLADAKTVSQVELAEFNHQTGKSFSVSLDDVKPMLLRSWLHADHSLAVPWRATSDTLWYYWGRYGRLVGYDIATRRCIGSLGPEGFAPNLNGKGGRFTDSTERQGSRTLHTATTLYQADLEGRAMKPLFTTTSDDPIVTASEIVWGDHKWEYTAVATKRFIHLLAADSQPVFKFPYESRGVARSQATVSVLEPPGSFALWLSPHPDEQGQASWQLPTQVVWLTREQGIVRRAEVPALPHHRYEPRPEERLMGAVLPPAGYFTLPWLGAGLWLRQVPRELPWLSWGGAVLICLPIGLWLGRRYHFSLAAQAGWAVFHVIFGVPGLLAFLSVQEWPARETCPNCKRLRLVDHTQCEHCGADFAPPEKTGTEIFAPLAANSLERGGVSAERR